MTPRPAAQARVGSGSPGLVLAACSERSGTTITSAETRAFLVEHGVDLAGEQEPKTRRALTFFSERLSASA